MRSQLNDAHSRHLTPTLKERHSFGLVAMNCPSTVIHMAALAWRRAFPATATMGKCDCAGEYERDHNNERFHISVLSQILGLICRLLPR